MKLEIIGVNLDAHAVTLSDGQVISITNYYLGDQEVAGGDLADRFVAGPDADGNWHASLFAEDDGEL